MAEQMERSDLPEESPTDLDTLLERGESACLEHRKVWPECASLHVEAEPADLPEGRQSNANESAGSVAPSDSPANERWVLAFNALSKALSDVGHPLIFTKRRKVTTAVLDAIAPAEVARVRADVSEEIARAIESIIGGYPDNEQRRPKLDRGEHANDWTWAAAIAREHAGKAFPSSPAALPDVVGTPDRQEADPTTQKGDTE